jgi:hypothetical protein
MVHPNAQMSLPSLRGFELALVNMLGKRSSGAIHRVVPRTVEDAVIPALYMSEPVYATL